MATITKMLLSGSTNGKNIKAVATATPGTLVHTAVTGTSSMDEIFLFVTNNDTADRLVTIEWGGTTAVDDTIQQTIPFKAGEYQVIPGFLLQNGLVVRVFCAAANVVTVQGFVNRIA